MNKLKLGYKFAHLFVKLEVFGFFFHLIETHAIFFFFVFLFPLYCLFISQIKCRQAFVTIFYITSQTRIFPNRSREPTRKKRNNYSNNKAKPGF